MPVDYSEYPPNWREISEHIRFVRAGGRCECEGECGQDHPFGRCEAMNHAPHPDTGSRVVLTVAHLCHGECSESEDEGRKCGNPGHLRAMCQACHLALDRERHVQKAVATRRANERERQREAGQISMPGME